MPPILARLSLSLALAAILGADQTHQESPAGMISAYASNRNQGVGNYVTHDMILLGHLLCLEEATTQSEEEIYSKEVNTIIKQLAAAAAHAATSDVTTANRNFLAVLDALANGKSPEAGPVKDEFSKVTSAQGISRSAIFPETIDYSQFRIRGNYTRTPELGRYFQTVRYASTVLFAVKETAATGITLKDADQLTAQALQLANWISSSGNIATAYKQYLNQTGLMFGTSDDLSMEDVLKANSLKGLPQQRAALLKAAHANGSQPQILGGIVDIGKLEPGVTAQDALTGWRLFPQRRSPDGAAFQQLIFPNVGAYLGKANPLSVDTIDGKKVKAFPLAVELPALLNFAPAVQALHATDDQNYEMYDTSFAKAKKALAPAAGSWLPVLQQLLSTKTDSAEVSDQLLITGTAYWTRNRHRSLLYEKQTYTPVVKGLELAPKRTDAYLEPSLELYRALLAQTQALAPALKPATATALRAIITKCISISQKESAGTKLDAVDIDFLNDIDHAFLEIAVREDTPVVVDVHTNPSSNQVLEEATGYPRPVDFKHADKMLRGARLTHFEFRHPMDSRMTDEEWQIEARSKATVKNAH